MFYIDSQRTVSHRESSLIRPKPICRSSSVGVQTTRTTVNQIPEQQVSKIVPRRNIQNELITWMFEFMVPGIVKSWQEIEEPGKDERLQTEEGVDVYKKKKGKSTSSIVSRAKMAVSKPKLSDRAGRRSGFVAGEREQPWWSSPDERAIIHFKNGNVYEGDISFKCMHGVGRFQWRDGTVYMGHFENNEMKGYGTIYWKDDTWYDGMFEHNLRHGKGIYVDSRKQRSYAGDWTYGTKDGYGRINYSRTLDNVYEGQFSMNMKHGYGTQEYCQNSGYTGMWHENKKEGQGVMIWPNTDYYLGTWNNNTMSGYGLYIWENYFNCTMVAPSLKIYRGSWKKGKRNDFGQIRFGSNLGAIYQGNFIDDKKSGDGKIMTTNGTIYKDKTLFIDDVGIYQTYSKLMKMARLNNALDTKQGQTVDFNICEENFALISYHVQNAINNIRKAEDIANTIESYLLNNRFKENKLDDVRNKVDKKFLDDLTMFEEYQLLRVIKNFEPSIRDLYNKYASICNWQKYYFEPFLIRLYMWQFFYDCNIQDHGLTLYDIDILFVKNSKLYARRPHDPFEKIFFWQFLHIIIAVACRIYCKNKYPGPRPDTIVAGALMQFMNNDVIRCASKEKGKLRQPYGEYIPLRATYELYQSIGEPHDIPTFLRAIRGSKHLLNASEVPVIDMPDSYLPLGRNAYTHAGEMMFLVDKIPEDVRIPSNYKLFNIANVPTRTIIRLFANIFPKASNRRRTLNLNYMLTFFEFFEVLVGCIEESIKLEVNCRF